MRLSLRLVFAGFLLLDILPAGAVDRRSVSPVDGWKIQPAKSPNIPPKADDWAIQPPPPASFSSRVRTGQALGYGDWRISPLGKGTSWAGVDHRSVNSLWYEKSLFIPAAWQGGDVALDFRRIEGDAIIFLNGVRVSELLRPGGEVDLTSSLQWGRDNVLRLFVTRDYTGISRDFAADPLRYLSRTGKGKDLPMSRWGLGLTGPVTLVCRPPDAITDVFCLPSWRNKALTLKVETTCRTPLPAARFHVIIRDATGRAALEWSAAAALAQGRSVTTLSAPWTDPIPWELDKPYLYTAQVAIEDARGTALDRFPDTTFGFREVWTEGRQLLMNGHPSRWRLTNVYGDNKYWLSFYRLLGYNFGQIQPHSGLWWRSWAETPMLDDGVLDEMDRLGVGCSAPAPSVNALRGALLTDERVRADYRREVEFYLRHYRNHPCILAWAVTMNNYCPKTDIDPQGMGKRVPHPPVQGWIIDAASVIVKEFDPTRLVYGHADGGVGDISTANVYLNFVPLQEREEWPLEWAAHGDMPYGAAEFGEPITSAFWKGKQFLLTEYLAMYLGDRAYLTEGEKGLRATIDYGLYDNVRGFGDWSRVDLSAYPGYWDFQSLFVRNTNRAWRTWGVNAGWNYWILNHPYGLPPEGDLTAPVDRKPAWVNPNFDIYHQANQPLLVYLAGSPRPTDKTHAYNAGESFQKQIAAVWDGPGSCSLKVGWTLHQGDKIFQSGMVALDLTAGAIRLVPINLQAPDSLTVRTEATVSLTVREGSRAVASDSFPIQIFPPAEKLATSARIAVYDPAGQSLPWLNALGVHPTAWTPGQSLDRTDLLILGRESLKPGEQLPYRPADVARGLRVLILEQKPEVWNGLGLETIEAMSRYIFVRDAASPILRGLSDEDLVNWRGTPDLLPEGRLYREYDFPHAPKWTNRHAVASVALKIPQLAGFTPILATEFDLAYSPLLEWRYGRGSVHFCSLDLTGRVGSDPAATRLAVNLLEKLTEKAGPDATRPVCYVGGPEGKALLDSLRVKIDPGAFSARTKRSLLVVGEPPLQADPAQIDAFISAGGQALYLPQSAQALARASLQTNTRSLVQAPDDPSPLFRAIGPNLLRWRDALTAPLFAPTGQPGGCAVHAGGLVLERLSGSGRAVYLQVGPGLLQGRYENDPDKKEAVQLSVVRLNQLVAQILTNLGASSTVRVADRLATIARPEVDENLGGWKILGPYIADKEDPVLMMQTVFPGEEDAIAGAENPNLTYTRKDGVVLDWRRVVDADETGFVNLENKLPDEQQSVTYVTRDLSSETSRTARLRFGVDYSAKIWLNGQLLLTVDQGHGGPAANQFQVDLPLRAGKNILTCKIGAGGKGCGFWASLAKPPVATPSRNGETVPNVRFYTPLFRNFDPYQFTYW